MSCMYVVVIIRRRKRLSRCPSRARQQAADAVIGVAKRTYGVVTPVCVSLLMATFITPSRRFSNTR